MVEMALPAEAANVADVAPFATTTPFGIVRFKLSLVSDTALQPTDGCVRVTVQLLEPPADRVAGVQLTDEGATTVVRLIVKAADPPFSVPVRVADWVVEKLPVATVNVAELLFAPTATEVGAVSPAALLFVSATVAPFAGAGFVSVTVQVVFALGPRAAARHCINDTAAGGATRVMVAVCEDPFKEAVTVGLSLTVNCLAVAGKVTLLEPPGIVTEAGTVRLAELTPRLTVAPVEPLTVTVHVLEAPGPRVDGAHPMLLIVVAATVRLSLNVAEVPLIEAVIVGVSFAVNCFADTRKVELVAPVGTVTEAGMVRLVELEPRFTEAPVEPLTVTVHVLEAPGASVAGAHTRLLAVSGTAVILTDPPVLVVVMPLPAAEAPKLLISPIVAPLLPDSVTVTVAMLPSPIVVAFIPHAMQIYPLAPPEQVTLLPAAVSAGPAVTVRLDTADAG